MKVIVVAIIGREDRAWRREGYGRSGLVSDRRMRNTVKSKDKDVLLQEGGKGYLRGQGEGNGTGWQVDGARERMGPG